MFQLKGLFWCSEELQTAVKAMNGKPSSLISVAMNVPGKEYGSYTCTSSFNLRPEFVRFCMAEWGDNRQI